MNLTNKLTRGMARTIAPLAFAGAMLYTGCARTHQFANYELTNTFKEIDSMPYSKEQKMDLEKRYAELKYRELTQKEKDWLNSKINLEDIGKPFIDKPLWFNKKNPSDADRVVLYNILSEGFDGINMVGLGRD